MVDFIFVISNFWVAYHLYKKGRQKGLTNKEKMAIIFFIVGGIFFLYDVLFLA